MRSLGYHRLISVENFRTPNFELVADILDWLIHRFEPKCGISDDITTEQRRVDFIKTVCERVVLKTGLKLNTRKLYQADGYAVKELLKLAQILYDAQKSVAEKGDFTTEENFGLSSKLSDLKSTRSLCSQIVDTGAGLFDLLQKEQDTRQDREKALRFLDGMSRNLESNSEHEVVEKAVMSMLGNHGQNLEQLKTMSDELQRDEKSLEQKIKKKRQELDRCKKRLSSLVNVRPAFMDEYEQLEQQFERYYEQYVGRFRNLDYLEHALDMMNREEKERMEENERALKRMQKRLRDEEWRLLRGEEDENEGEKRKPKKGAGSKSWMPPQATGGMNVGDDGELSDDSASSDPPISVGGSQASEDPPVSLGGSASDDDILNESEEDDDVSGDDGLGGGGFKGGRGNDFNF
jgi:clusterin-associated protein 1